MKLKISVIVCSLFVFSMYSAQEAPKKGDESAKDVEQTAKTVAAVEKHFPGHKDVEYQRTRLSNGLIYHTIPYTPSETIVSRGKSITIRTEGEKHCHDSSLQDEIERIASSTASLKDKVEQYKSIRDTWTFTAQKDKNFVESMVNNWGRELEQQQNARQAKDESKSQKGDKDE